MKPNKHYNHYNHTHNHNYHNHGKHGKGAKGKGEARITPVHHNPSNYTRYQAGEEVQIFYRYEYDGSGDGPEAYFPVSNKACGQLMPRMGKTDCWQPATVVQNWSPDEFDKNTGAVCTGILVRLMHPVWYNRHGHLLDCSTPKNTEVRIHPADIVRGSPPPVKTSFVVVRWGGHYKTPDYNELSGDEGGWGSIGTSISDGYIKHVFDRVYQRMGNTYEVLTCYVQSAQDLARLTATAVVPQLYGERMAACYFLWPVAFTDGTSKTPGYIEKDSLFATMKDMENNGVESAFPHSGFLYKMLVSKDWCSYLSGSTEMRCPATTKVMRSQIVQNSEMAAATCLQALSELTQTGCAITSGVAKLGYSWEASDVLSFSGQSDLARKLETLLSAPGCEADNVIVQEFIPSDLEIRVFTINGAPIKMLYTKFCENTDDGAFTGFKSVTREYAVQHWFQGNDMAMSHAEAEMMKLTKLWMRWVRGITSKLPSFLRLDYFVKRDGNRSIIHTGELTEMGASCLGWADGWTATFDAIIHSASGMAFPQILKPLKSDLEYDEKMDRNAKRVRQQQH